MLEPRQQQQQQQQAHAARPRVTGEHQQQPQQPCKLALTATYNDTTRLYTAMQAPVVKPACLCSALHTFSPFLH